MHLKWGWKASNVAGEIHLELSWLQLVAFCGFESRLLCGLQGPGDNSAVGWIRYAGTCGIIRHDGKGASILSMFWVPCSLGSERKFFKDFWYYEWLAFIYQLSRDTEVRWVVISRVCHSLGILRYPQSLSSQINYLRLKGSFFFQVLGESKCFHTTAIS